MNACHFVLTSRLEIACLELNPAGRRSAVLVRDWPYSPETRRAIAPALAEAGFRVLMPSLRGYGQTRFLYPQTPRSGQFTQRAAPAVVAAHLLKFIGSC